jgi:predicted anti-sigma-YlaC factor YlaD
LRREADAHDARQRAASITVMTDWCGVRVGVDDQQHVVASATARLRPRPAFASSVAASVQVLSIAWRPSTVTATCTIAGGVGGVVASADGSWIFSSAKRE